MSTPTTGKPDPSAAAKPAAVTPPAEKPPATPPAPDPKPKAKAREYADGYQPTGKVRVIAESKHAQVLEDDLRRWKEPL